MKNLQKTAGKIYRHFMNDSLYRNSIYLMLSNAVLAVFGYVFWLVNAHRYSAASIGLATALIASVNLIVNLSQLGFNTAIIRTLSLSKNKNGIINAATIILITSSLVLTIGYIVFVSTLSPRLDFIKHQPLLILAIIFFGIISTLNVFTDNIFVSYRATGYTLTVNIILGAIRLLLSLFLVNEKQDGLFLAFAAGVTACMIFSYLALIKLGYSPFAKPDFSEIKKMARISFGNYVANIFTLLPALILPVIITNQLSPTKAGYFYMAFTIAQAIYAIPVAVTTAFLAEGSHTFGELKYQLIKAVYINSILLLPLVIIIVVFSTPLLKLFGSQYALNSTVPLKILTLSSLFFFINYVFITLYRLLNKVMELALSQLVCATIVILILFSSARRGLGDTAWGWFIGQAVIAFILGIRFSHLYMKSTARQANHI